MKKNFKHYFFLYCFSGGWLVGATLGYFYQPPTVVLYSSLIIVILFYFYWPQIKILCLLFVIVGCLFGFWRWEFLSVPTAEQNQIWKDNEVELRVQVVAEVDIRTDRQLITVKKNDIYSQTDDRILITAPLYPTFNYGDVLVVKGKLQPPPVFTDFDYAAYLARFGISSVMYYPQLSFVNQKFSFYGQLLGLKIKLIDRVNQLLPEPEAAFLNGLLWGAKRSIPTPIREQFNITGTTHIVALSGYNITVLGLIIFLIAPWLGLHRRYAFWLVLLIIVMFILLTGYPASVVRAGIMGILVLIAYRWGGGVKPGILLITSATVMSAINPYILLFDVGFQLSFLATIGLIYLAPVLEKIFISLRISLPTKFGLKESVIATSAAIIMTAPLIIYQFGRFSLVALLVNILILFVIPLIMALGFMAVLVSFIFYSGGQLLAWLAYVGLHYVIFITGYFSNFSWAMVNISSPGLLTILIVYIILILIIFYARRSWSVVE